MAGGRPTKYRPKYCQMLIEHMTQGLSFESFSGVIEVNQDTLHEWVKVHPEFSDAKKLGFGKSQLVWEKMFMAGCMGKLKNFSAAGTIFNMKNRFKWRDQIDLSGGDAPVAITLNYNLEDE